MRDAGCPRTNPSNPDLLAALAEGVTPEVLADTVREGIDRGIANPCAWAIATARGRHAEGAKPIPIGNGTGPPAKSKTRSAAETLLRGTSYANPAEQVAE